MEKNIAFSYLVTPSILFLLAIIFIFILILGVGVIPSKESQTPWGPEGSNGSLYILNFQKPNGNHIFTQHKAAEEITEMSLIWL